MHDIDLEKYVGALLGVIWAIVKLASMYGSLQARRAERAARAAARPGGADAPRSEPALVDAAPGSGTGSDTGLADVAPPSAAPWAGMAFGAPRAPDADRLRVVLLRLAELEQSAAALGDVVRHERANRRFTDALLGAVPREIGRLRAAVDAGLAAREAEDAADTIELVVGEIAVLVRQRRDPSLLPELGDADALADACYAPVIAFARAEGLPLRSGAPATQLTGFDLAIWTGFIPTSIAPIFLPVDFFSTPLRWPALAHEIGHDFLASVDGLEPALRRELGLGGEQVRPLAPDGDRIAAPALRRMFGVWFEEIFCDVFGTLMFGPAYVLTMSELFFQEDEPYASIAVQTDVTGARYDEHPPPHLRVLIGCMVLERGGLNEDARALREAWARRHAEVSLDDLLLPVRGAFRPVPLAPFATMAAWIVERLYAGPLTALSGFGLQDISGLDYGPHERQEASRARDALLAGRVPAVLDARALLTGAVLAAHRAPAQSLSILIRARAAIPALGTAERRPDAFGSRLDVSSVALDRRAVAEALLFREVLLPPRALRPRRRARL
ncbi:hypothetical protein ACSRUE_21645 [Sorangium sp. KYC3313]|uniref:hypothetical protein n=1 Tax=Sorangium sp. KYC3313 TaxID=3449740 RepID=UPI003F8BD22A